MNTRKINFFESLISQFQNPLSSAYQNRDNMAPQTMKAIKVVSSGKAGIQDVAVPSLRDGEILVKVNYVAANPIDW